MASYSQTIVVGNLGRDPETRYLANGDPVCNFSVAVTESWKDKGSGEKREKTTWFRVSTFGKLAEICGQYLAKGSSVMVVGKMESRKYEKDGVEREMWELRADSMQMLGGGQGGQRQQQGGQQGGGDYAPATQRQPKPRPSFDDLGDDIPF